jgi:DinB family protein
MAPIASRVGPRRDSAVNHEDAMDPSLSVLAAQFQFGNNFFTKALRGLDRAALISRPGPDSNPPLWIAGHLLQFRMRLTGVLGEPVEVPWESLFSTGSKLGDLSTYPEGDDILTRWVDVSQRLMRRLEIVTPADLAARPNRRVPSMDGSLLGAITMFAWHEAYHTGQLGYLRKWLGRGALFD